MGTALKNPVSSRPRVTPSFVIFVTLALSPERQSARMSRITNDGLTGLAQDVLKLYSYGNSGRQRVNLTVAPYFYQILQEAVATNV